MLALLFRSYDYSVMTDKEPTPPASDLFHFALAGAETADDVAEVWHAYLEGSPEAHAKEVAEASIRLNEGMPVDAVEIANRGIASRARAVVQRQHEQSSPEQLNP
jgi:hypothetical protein